MRKLISCTVLLVLLSFTWSSPSHAASPRSDCQCVEFARCATGMVINGSGAQWDDNAKGLGYNVVSAPSVGGAMNFDPGAYGADSKNGHVAKVVAYSQTKDGLNWVVTVHHANWEIKTDQKLTECGCSNVREHVFTVPKSAKNVHYIAPPNYNNLVNRKSSKCIDLKGGNTGNGTHLIENSCSKEDSMKWQLVGISVGANYDANSYYQVKNKKSGKCMDTEGGNTADWTRIIEYSCSTDDNMQWQPVSPSFLQSQLKNKKSGRCIDLDHGVTDNGTDVILYDCGSATNTNMKWTLNPL